MNLLKKIRDFYSDTKAPKEDSAYDGALVVLTFTLMFIGLIIVSSASIPEGIALSSDPFQFLKRHAIYIILCIGVLAFAISVPIDFWYRYQGVILLLSFLGLLAVLIFGVEVNGSHRWLRLGPLNIQPSEFSKIAIIFFLSSYLSRKQEEVADTITGFIKPLIVLSIFSVLLLLQPDLGSTVVIVVIMMGILFIGNAKLVAFISIAVSLLSVIVALILYSPYRIKRVIGFLDPWADPYGRSYQLTQSLMAFGRGGWSGVGLGNSVQKLEYLPEAHTDFIMAILAEEMGFIGVTVVILLEFILIYKAFVIGKRTLNQVIHINDKHTRQKFIFMGYVPIGIAIWFAFQTIVNVGAASGMVPTKGLTLPLISYGGSSLINIGAAIGILLRVDFETKLFCKAKDKNIEDDDPDSEDTEEEITLK